MTASRADAASLTPGPTSAPPVLPGMRQADRLLPGIAPEAEAMPGAVYSPFADRIASHPGPLFPLHVGDTWRDPFVGARSEDIASADHKRLHAYADTRGLPELIESIREKLEDRNGLQHSSDEILVTAGATGGLSALAGALLSPGDEMLILAPFWPLIRGIAQSFRAKPVEVPFFDRVDSEASAEAAVEACVTPRSRVLYVSTPSNPTGRIIPEAWLKALATLARRHNLWIFADEVYEDYHYLGGSEAHASIARYAPERTISVYSFSKSYAMAGQRVGYLAGPAKAIENARKLGTHLYYHPPVVGQRTALAALREGGDWLAEAHRQDREVGLKVAEILGESSPQGGTFLFVDVRDRLDSRGMDGLLEDCFDQGVLVAPGGSCGAAYAGWIRMSYTAAPAAEVLDATGRLASVLGR